MLRYADFEDQWSGKPTVVKRNSRQFQNHMAHFQERERNKKWRIMRVRGYAPRAAGDWMPSGKKRFETEHQAAKADWIHHQIERWFSVRKIQRMYKRYRKKATSMKTGHQSAEHIQLLCRGYNFDSTSTTTGAR